MQWNKVEDGWPPQYEDVLVTDGANIQIGYLLKDNYWGSEADDFVRISSENVTHWAWLPPLPEAE